MYLPFFAAFAASFLLLNFSLAYPKAALSSINPEAFHPRILMAKVNAKKIKMVPVILILSHRAKHANL